LRIGTEEDLVEYYQDDSASDEAEYWVPLSTRDSIKTLVTPAFSSWTTEQLEDYQTFYEELDLDAAESDAEYVPMTWTVTSTSSPMASSKKRE
jgi:chitinase